MSLDDISKAAEKERAKNNRPSKPVFTKEKVYIPVSPESWKIYRRIYPYHIHFGFTVIFLVLVIFFGVFWIYNQFDWCLYAFIGTASVFLMRLSIHYILKIHRFTHYKNWRKTLGFPVNGWDFLGSVKEYPKKFEWDKEISVKINFRDTAQNEERKLMHDALYLLTINANKQFYDLEFSQSGYSGDIRNKWMITDKLFAVGSGDESVVGEIYRSLDKHFRAIQEKYKCIESVEIKFSKKFFTAEPPTSSGD